MKIERKDSGRGRKEFLASVEIEAKMVDDEGGFEGYGAIFNIMDSGNDIILPGAFAKSLREIPATKVRMLWNHSPDEVIGKFTEMREDTKGLWCKGALNLETQRGKEVHSNLKFGAVEGLSIGYRTIRRELDSDEGVRKLIELSLWEISVVTFPMHGGAGVTAVKHGKLPSKREFERALARDVGLSLSQAKRLMASGWKGLSEAERDAGAETVDLGDMLGNLSGATSALRG